MSANSASARDNALELLASWIAGPARFEGLGDAVKALEALVKTQGKRRPAPGSLNAALRVSLAQADAERLRDLLLVQVARPGCPVELLDGFFWKFGTEADRLVGAELLAAIRTFVEDLCGEDFDPQTDEVCHPEEVVLQFGQMLLLGCSHPPDSSPRFFTARLHSADGQAFRAGELMCEVVRVAADPLRDSGHRFFHRLKLVGQVGDPAAWIPMYEMRFSSDWVPPGVDPEIGWERLQNLEEWRANWRRQNQQPPGDPKGTGATASRRRRGSK
jgi:hypothetical protein